MFKKAGISQIVVLLGFIFAMVLLYYMITNSWNIKAASTAMLGIFGK
jgi:hypothetical protein